MMGAESGSPMEVAMVAYSLRRHAPGSFAVLDWVLILVGALIAWLFWPPTHP
jgi:hypothetical protein